ncbi:DUF6388 family protein, partial [Pseudomonas brenneri]|uniref:DUF6388 family protein n=1 Tax=Pseudomonas brenneri TaxID=129817 RepID=UPI003BA2F7E8
TGTLLLSLSTIAGAKISNPSWVIFQSAEWVSFQSAPTLNYSLAENCRLSPEEYRLKFLKEAFETEADAHDCDCWDFILQWVAETKEELELMREERMKEIYDSLDN